MSKSKDTDLPRRRKPGGGRKPGYSEPVTVVSISMDPSTLRQIDREALRAGRSRSAFVRWALRRTCARLFQKREDERFAPEPLASPEFFDRTHGGRFDPDREGEPWTCEPCAAATCPADPHGPPGKLLAGWLVCPGCGFARGTSARRVGAGDCACGEVHP